VTSNRRRLLIVLLTLVLSLQSTALLGVAALFSYETLTSPSLSLGGSVFFDVLVWISALAAGAVTRGFWAGRSATRAAIVVWQMLFVGIAIATGQGPDARFDLALVIGIPAALVTAAMLFAKSVTAHLERK
jgi:peptidoglycan/LPS O-acetylase OafA/YrhL